MCLHKCASVQVRKCASTCSSAQVCNSVHVHKFLRKYLRKYTSAQVGYASAQVRKCSSTQVRKYASEQVRKCASMQMHRYASA